MSSAPGANVGAGRREVRGSRIVVACQRCAAPKGIGPAPVLDSHCERETRDELKALRVLAKVIDEGGFARAARALNMAPPVVTRMPAELENQLGARLLNRTTRSIALTGTGAQYVERVRHILLGVDEAQALASHSTKLPRDHLRLLCSPAVAVHRLAKHLPRLQAQFPQATLEIDSPSAVDTLDVGYDITIFASRRVRRPPAGGHRSSRLRRARNPGPPRQTGAPERPATACLPRLSTACTRRRWPVWVWRACRPM